MPVLTERDKAEIRVQIDKLRAQYANVTTSVGRARLARKIAVLEGLEAIAEKKEAQHE